MTDVPLLLPNDIVLVGLDDSELDEIDCVWVVSGDDIDTSDTVLEAEADADELELPDELDACAELVELDMTLVCELGLIPVGELVVSKV